MPGTLQPRWCHILHQIIMAQSLEETARQLAAPGKGLLASDESTGTIGKRLEKALGEGSNTEVSTDEHAPPAPTREGGGYRCRALCLG